MRAVVQARCPEVKWVQVTALYKREREGVPRATALGAMIAEVTTYLTKGPSEKRLADGAAVFTHPLLVVLMEQAMMSRPHYWGYGSLRAVVAQRRAQWKGIVDTPKTGTARTVPLVPELADVLREHRRALIAAQHRGVETGGVFPSANGGLYHQGALNKPLARACEAAGIKRRLTVHGLRRTFNDLCRRVTSGEVVRAMTGHVTVAMTEHCSHVDADEKRAAAAAVLRLARGRTGAESVGEIQSAPEPRRSGKHEKTG